MHLVDGVGQVLRLEAEPAVLAVARAALACATHGAQTPQCTEEKVARRGVHCVWPWALPTIEPSRKLEVYTCMPGAVVSTCKGR